jgi:hypothetical protein
VILCQRPFRLYDVDAAGLAGLVVLAALGAWRLPAEWDRVTREYRQRGALYAGVEAQLRAELPAVAERETRVAEAVEALRARQAGVPTVHALPDLLRDLAELVRAADLELVRFTPQPVQREGVYDLCEIEFSARGSIVKLIGFLDRLAQRHAGHELRTCSVTRGGGAACELSWKLRIYLLPPPAAKSGEPS